MAQSFATLDEFSGGRTVAGLGVSHKPVVEGWYGQSIDKPLAEIREYVEIMRAIFRGEDPPAEESAAPASTSWATSRGADLPIYLAALSPGMLRLAGEIADGVILWLCNPNYIRDVVVPTGREGREKAGKELDGFDIVAAVPSAAHRRPDGGREQLRSELVTYFHLPFYRAMIERSGFEADEGAASTSAIRAARRRLRRRRGRSRVRGIAPRPGLRGRALALRGRHLAAPTSTRRSRP